MNMKQTKRMKKAVSFVITATLCATMIAPVSAAELPERVDSGKAALVGYMETMKDNRGTLEQLMQANERFSKQITVQQRELKQAGVLSAEDGAVLAQMSAQIQQQRLVVGSLHEEVEILKVDGQEYMSADDVEAAKATLDAVMELQEQQIAAQSALSALLNTRLDYLKEVSSGAAVPETDAETNVDIIDVKTI